MNTSFYCKRCGKTAYRVESGEYICMGCGWKEEEKKLKWEEQSPATKALVTLMMIGTMYNEAVKKQQDK